IVVALHGAGTVFVLLRWDGDTQERSLSSQACTLVDAQARWDDVYQETARRQLARRSCRLGSRARACDQPACAGAVPTAQNERATGAPPWLASDTRPPRCGS